MGRLSISDDIRRLRLEEKRSPIDAAFYAVVALSEDDLEALSVRFNRTFANCTPPISMAINRSTVSVPKAE